MLQRREFIKSVLTTIIGLIVWPKKAKALPKQRAKLIFLDDRDKADEFVNKRVRPNKAQEEISFELGKYYEHTTGSMIHIICEADTTIYGKSLIAETSNGMFLPIGKNKENAVNFKEITKEKWMEIFNSCQE